MLKFFRRKHIFSYVLTTFRYNNNNNNNKSFSTCPPDPLNKFSPQKIAVVQGRGGQKELIRKFLKKYYLKDDPLLSAAGLNKNDALLDFFIKDMREELILLAIKPDTGQVLGMSYNSVVDRNTTTKMREEAAKELKNDPAYRAICFFADVTDKANLFKRFDVCEIFECSFLATHPSARRQGIAKYLILKSRHLAHSAGYVLFKIDCTSEYSSRIAKRIGMEKLPTRQIADYVDTKGTPWISAVPAAPNNKLIVYFERLSPVLYSIFPPPPQLSHYLVNENVKKKTN